MATATLLNAVTVAGAGASSSFVPNASTAQFIITGVATVKLEGSLDNVNWSTIVQTSVTDSFTDLPKFTHYRGNVPSISGGGTVTLLVSN